MPEVPEVPQVPAFNLTELDHKLLAMTDEEFVYHDWEDLKSIIARNDLGALKRKPSDLRRYLAWTQETKAKYAAVTPRLSSKAGPRRPSKTRVPLPIPRTTRSSENDWPYGVTPGISHLVVWLRTPIPVKSDEGHLTDESRAMIDTFVRKTFVDRLAKDPQNFPDPESHVLWFKNWVGLQSVRALEHVHILVRDVPEDILFEWTNE
ncbi:hypothetical protein N7519_003060 [Penicillium mononematosum]|uniref:uncharacterized protein n=1 Tax=Penicillium mononematosum TaxID=268346 RepID=UPI0025494164|nr:uncharacterized protein N7519_003060 [Penicillium mononematosum]KAJ6188152.1 hypothetical protein N7519_003060 [Penicillium mononematosum]